MKHIIDIEKWERRDNYRLFENAVSSTYSLTSEVECGKAYAAAKASAKSFFVYYLYAVLRAANEVKEFRTRTDKANNVVYYDTVDILTPIAVPGRTFYTIRVKYYEDFDMFYSEARKLITSIPFDGNPYEADNKVNAKGDYDVILLSATPKLYFTSTSSSSKINFPLMNIGKAVMREGRLVMPLSMNIDHKFIDGAHIQQFIEKVEKYLNC